MRKDIADRWVAALRSGQYKKGKGTLKQAGLVSAYCCLGVLCDLHGKETGAPWRNRLNSGREEYMGSYTKLPTEVRDWAGMGSTIGCISDSRGRDTVSCMIQVGDMKFDDLITANDGGKTFAEIADAIEANFSFL